MPPEDESQADFLQSISEKDLQEALNAFSAEKEDGLERGSSGSSFHSARDLRTEEITDRHIGFKVCYNPRTHA